MAITPAQRRLIELLISELALGVAAERRWERASDIARRYAEEGQLLLMRDWTADFVLDVTGIIRLIDTETGQPPRPATVSERRIVLFQALRHYPERHSLLPRRPPKARTCDSCGGTGVPEVVFTKPSLRNVICQCGGAGWIVRDITSASQA